MLVPPGNHRAWPSCVSADYLSPPAAHKCRPRLLRKFQSCLLLLIRAEVLFAPDFKVEHNDLNKVTIIYEFGIIAVTWYILINLACPTAFGCISVIVALSKSCYSNPQLYYFSTTNNLTMIATLHMKKLCL